MKIDLWSIFGPFVKLKNVHSHGVRMHFEIVPSLGLMNIDNCFFIIHQYSDTTLDPVSTVTRLTE